MQAITLQEAYRGQRCAAQRAALHTFHIKANKISFKVTRHGDIIISDYIQPKKEHKRNPINYLHTLSKTLDFVMLYGNLPWQLKHQSIN